MTCKIGGGDRHIINQIVDRKHVGEPEDKIRAFLSRKFSKVKKRDKKLFGCAVGYGIARHRHNRRVYRQVMSGRF